jgi:Rrf2 family nitric oxide-sensitive transcriptional repressor
MRLTSYSDYSLRVLIYLALRGGRLATIAEISQAYGISKAHLMKVAHELGRAGYIETSRGRGGGLGLARAPGEITVGEVVRQTEGSMDLVECFDPDTSHCRIEPACALRGVLEEALDAFLATLDRYTLANLVARRRKPLTELLAAPVDPSEAAR